MEKILYRVLDSHYMAQTRPIDEVDHRGDSRRLSAPGRADNKNQTLRTLSYFQKQGGEVKVLERRNYGIAAPRRKADHPALTKNVHPESMSSVNFVSEIKSPVLVELLSMCRAEDLKDQLLDQLFGQRAARSVLQIPVEPKLRRLPNFQVYIARERLDRNPEILVYFRVILGRCRLSGGFFFSHTNYRLQTIRIYYPSPPLKPMQQRLGG